MKLIKIDISVSYLCLVKKYVGLKEESIYRVLSYYFVRMLVDRFFELSGVLVSHGFMDQNLYLDIFNPTPFWNKATPIVEGMRTKRPHIYENFELLNNKRLSWKKRRK